MSGGCSSTLGVLATSCLSPLSSRWDSKRQTSLALGPPCSVFPVRGSNLWDSSLYPSPLAMTTATL
ncbi:hypothetical protein AXF42_Ash020501 [Apostasia shenzhenica]|uniref:Uncharacterized protein n=1 Tax=Apostasia shenzhenica TaxID=1088818 RepID=A0A2H9ZXZ7_9ASPA|nr:hypothetical protein AXF42_Ash020501 [Apostasia shenzhenica]